MSSALEARYAQHLRQYPWKASSSPTSQERKVHETISQEKVTANDRKDQFSRRKKRTDTRYRNHEQLRTQGNSVPRTLFNPQLSGASSHATLSSCEPTGSLSGRSPGQENQPTGASISSNSQEQIRSRIDKPDIHQHGFAPPAMEETDIIFMPTHPRYPGMIMQPESRLISQEQLCAEVKSIYAGLTMVESKCIHVDKAQACTIRGADGKENRIADDHWQALIALHRTLLHEHHDFFLASQHPSASPALHRLATKYTMPPRMWKHGIHSFLELLRYRLPDSLDFMIKFIYTAYQMMSLLYETVPTFEDTWIECLGDLGRYRMAIEDDDIQDNETWAGVARFWYSMADNRSADDPIRKAADRSTKVEKLYHHLTNFARPDHIKQLYDYSRSLSLRVFGNARGSISTLFNPLREQSKEPSWRLSELDNTMRKFYPWLFDEKVTQEVEISQEQWPGGNVYDEYRQRFKKYHSGAAASTNQKLGTEADRCEPLGELLRLARLSSPVTKTPIGKGHFTKKRAEYVVPGFVDSIYVPACADNGAGLNIMSEAFAKTHKFTINTTSRTSIRLPQGTFVKSMGVTTCIYQFAGETECHSISFAVLPNCVKDIILGRPFLSLTKTLTDFAHRIKKEFVNISSKLTRLLLMGSSDQRVRGTINGEQVLALPDTGSDIMILSKRYARSLGLTIQTEPEHRQWVELADGSQICTYGTVLDANWSYGYCTSKNLSYECDFHVLEDLECDVILSNEFLYDTHAFTSHEEHFIDFDDGAEDWSELRLFRLLYKTLKDEFPQLTEEELEHSRRAEADTYIANLPEVDRDAAQAIEDRLREEWDRNFVAATTTSSAPGAEHQSSGQVNSQGDSTLVSTIRRFHSRLFRRRKAHEAVKLTGVGG